MSPPPASISESAPYVGSSRFAARTRKKQWHGRKGNFCLRQCLFPPCCTFWMLLLLGDKTLFLCLIHFVCVCHSASSILFFTEWASAIPRCNFLNYRKIFVSIINVILFLVFLATAGCLLYRVSQIRKVSAEVIISSFHCTLVNFYLCVFASVWYDARICLSLQAPQLSEPLSLFSHLQK